MNNSERRKLLYEIIFGTDTKFGKLFDVILISLILASYLLLMAGSVKAIDTKYNQIIIAFEWAFTIIFTIEYLTRIYCSPRPLKYITSFYGIVDLIATMPLYIALLFPSAHYLLIIRLVRVLRIFRILRLNNYLKDSNILLSSINNSKRKILVFFLAMLIFVIVLGTLIYIVEGPKNGFNNLFISVYWAIVTMTTVGYGDLVPHTVLGKGIAAFTMLLGYCTLVVTTGIVSAQFISDAKNRTSSNNIKCPNCGQVDHNEQAIFCFNCGAELPSLKK